MAYNYQAARAAGLTDEDINKYLATKQGQTPQTPKSGGGGLTDWLPTIGAIGGSFIPGAGTLAGGALGAGLGTILKGEITGQGDPREVLKETALGFGGGILGKGISKVAGKVLPKAASKVAGQAGAKASAGLTQKLAAKTIASNFTIPPKLAPQLALEDSLGQWILDGVPIPKSIKGYQNITSQITGDSGAITQAQRSATKKLKIPINFEQPLTDAHGFIGLKGGLSADEKLDTLSTIRNYFNSRSYPAPGHIGADDALDIANALDKEGYQLYNKGINELSPNAMLEAKGETFLGVAEDLRNQISRGIDNTGIFTKVQAEAVTALEKVSPQLAQRARQATNMGQLRSIAAPYVKINRAAQSTLNRQQTPFTGGALGLGARGAGALAGGGIAGLPGAAVGAALAPAAQGAMQAAQPAITGLAAQGILGAGKLTEGAGRLGQALPQAVGQIGIRAGMPEQQAQLEQPISEEIPTEIPTSIQSNDQQLKTAFAVAILQNPKQYSAIKGAYDLLFSGKEVSADQQKEIKNLQETRILVKTFAKEVTNLGASDFGPAARATGVTRKLLGTLGLDPDVRSFTQVRKAMRVKMARAMSEVGNLTEQEQEVALNLIPDIGDSSKEIAEKVRLVEQILSGAEKRSQKINSSLPTPEGGLLEGFIGG